MNVVGLSGKMGSGKDFVHGWFNEQGYSVTRRAFADAVRFDIEEHISDGMFLNALWEKPHTPEARALLQWWGTDYRRGQDPNYWIARMRAFLQKMDSEPGTEDMTVFLTDMRFQNEIEVVKEFGGQSWRIWAPDSVRRERLNLSKEDLALLDSHVSESGLDHYPHFDAIIESKNEVLTPMNLHSKERFVSILQTTHLVPNVTSRY